MIALQRGANPAHHRMCHAPSHMRYVAATESHKIVRTGQPRTGRKSGQSTVQRRHNRCAPAARQPLLDRTAPHCCMHSHIWRQCACSGARVAAALRAVASSGRLGTRRALRTRGRLPVEWPTPRVMSYACEDFFSLQQASQKHLQQAQLFQISASGPGSVPSLSLQSQCRYSQQHMGRPSVSHLLSLC